MGYWDVHGYIGGMFFVLFLLLLPRVTLLVSVSFWAAATYVAYTTLGLPAFLGWPLSLVLAIIGWVLWLVSPRILIGLLATLFYVHTNIFMVGVALFMGYSATKILWQVVRFAYKDMSIRWRTIKMEYERAKTKPTMRQRAEAWWEVLGVGKDASMETIRAAYTSIAKATHPDTAKEHADPERFRKATEAFKEAKKDR